MPCGQMQQVGLSSPESPHIFNFDNVVARGTVRVQQGEFEGESTKPHHEAMIIIVEWFERTTYVLCAGSHDVWGAQKCYDLRNTQKVGRGPKARGNRTMCLAKISTSTATGHPAACTTVYLCGS